MTKSDAIAGIKQKRFITAQSTIVAKCAVHRVEILTENEGMGTIWWDHDRVDDEMAKGDGGVRNDD